MSKTQASASFSICEYLRSALDIVREAKPIGLIVPSGSTWETTAPTPYAEASHLLI